MNHPEYYDPSHQTNPPRCQLCEQLAVVLIWALGINPLDACWQVCGDHVEDARKELDHGHGTDHSHLIRRAA